MRVCVCAQDEDDDEEATSASNAAPAGARGSGAGIGEAAGESGLAALPSEKTPVPLVDYVLNVMKFVDAILSNNSTDDHCREFVAQRGLTPLMGILGLPNLPVDFPVTPACQAVAAVCKSILNLAHEPQVSPPFLQLHIDTRMSRTKPQSSQKSARRNYGLESRLFTSRKRRAAGSSDCRPFSILSRI